MLSNTVPANAAGELEVGDLTKAEFVEAGTMFTAQTAASSAGKGRGQYLRKDKIAGSYRTLGADELNVDEGNVVIEPKIKTNEDVNAADSFDPYAAHLGAEVRGSGMIEVRHGSAYGELLTGLDFESSDAFADVFSNIVAPVGGAKDMYFVYSDKDTAMKLWQFDGAKKYDGKPEQLAESSCCSKCSRGCRSCNRDNGIPEGKALTPITAA